jgi:hypothetical protein
MGTVHSIGSNLAYLKQLVGAALDGIDSARHELNCGVYTSPFQAVVWTPAIGATIGMLSTRLIGNRKSASSVAIGGLVGSVLGFAAGLVWTSRRLIGPSACTAIRRVNATRDAHWLETHPIDYA